MKTQTLQKLIEIAVMENRNEKICLIEDIFKVGRCLFGMNVPGFEQVISAPEKVFDRLYDCTIEQLEVEYAYLSAVMSQRARILANIDAE